MSKNPNNILVSLEENAQRLKPEDLSFQKQNGELRVDEEKSIKCKTIKSGKRQIDSVETKELLVKKSSKNKENMKFVACTPKVLYKDPFKPVYNKRKLKASPFNLHSNKRDVKLMKEKEEGMRKEIELKKIQQEKEKLEDIEYRATLVHHAKPVPNMSKPFIPQKSDAPLTIPISPTKTRKIYYLL